MKLFVWTGFCPDYTGGLAVALAKNEAEARKLIIEERGFSEPYNWGTLTVYRVDRRCAISVSGGG